MLLKACRKIILVGVTAFFTYLLKREIGTFKIFAGRLNACGGDGIADTGIHIFLKERTQISRAYIGKPGDIL